MTGFIPKENLTAYQRWELAAFDEAEQKAAEAKRRAGQPSQPAGTVATSPAPDAVENQAVDEAVKLPTAADIERMHEEAHQQGYAAGHAEGLAKAQAAAARLDALMNGLRQSVGALEQNVADELLAMALEIASQMLRQSLKLKPELMLPVVREAVAALNSHSGHPALFAHPDDAALIRSHLGEQLAHNNWRIIEDSTLSRGGCRVELGASEVDATRETRWRRVVESIGISEDWLAEQRANDD